MMPRMTVSKSCGCGTLISTASAQNIRPTMLLRSSEVRLSPSTRSGKRSIPDQRAMVMEKTVRKIWKGVTFQRSARARTLSSTRRGMVKFFTMRMPLPHISGTPPPGAFTTGWS